MVSCHQLLSTTVNVDWIDLLQSVYFFETFVIISPSKSDSSVLNETHDCEFEIKDRIYFKDLIVSFYVIQNESLREHLSNSVYHTSSGISLMQVFYET